MSNPTVTISLLTCNRPDTLGLTLESILAQTYTDFQVLVLDNCSTDNTPQIVQSYAAKDCRVQLIRNETNIGIARNWNKGMQLNRSPYVTVFHDDDIMLPTYLSTAISALEKNPSAAFSLTRTQFIDQHGKITGDQDMGELPAGLVPGSTFLELFAASRGPGVYPPTVLYRGDAAREAGYLESPHTRGWFDNDFAVRIAARHDVFVIHEPLVQYRMHQGSDTELLNKEAGGTPWYGEVTTKMDALAHLMKSERAADPKFRAWLSNRLLQLHTHASAAIHTSIPAMYHSWETREAYLHEQLDRTVPAGESLILLDDGQLGFAWTWNGRKVIPFTEAGGHYNGPPSDDAHALAELKRLKAAGARWLAVAWPCFWWLDQYNRFALHLEHNTTCRLRTPHVVIHEL